MTEWQDSDNFLATAVPVGESYSCGRMTVELTNASVYIWDMHLQPFAEYTDGQYGPGEDVNNASEATGMREWICGFNAHRNRGRTGKQEKAAI